MEESRIIEEAVKLQIKEKDTSHCKYEEEVISLRKELEETKANEEIVSLRSKE